MGCDLWAHALLRLCFPRKRKQGSRLLLSSLGQLPIGFCSILVTFPQIQPSGDSANAVNQQGVGAAMGPATSDRWDTAGEAVPVSRHLLLQSHCVQI